MFLVGVGVAGQLWVRIIAARVTSHHSCEEFVKYNEKRKDLIFQ